MKTLRKQAAQHCTEKGGESSVHAWRSWPRRMRSWGKGQAALKPAKASHAAAGISLLASAATHMCTLPSAAPLYSSRPKADLCRQVTRES
jgi:hypothetical protein